MQTSHPTRPTRDAIVPTSVRRFETDGGTPATEEYFEQLDAYRTTYHYDKTMYVWNCCDSRQREHPPSECVTYQRYARWTKKTI